MGWFVYLVGGLMIFAGGLAVGVIWTERKYEKHSPFMVRYMGLTTKSKALVMGYMHARGVNDERTTYRERH